MRSSTFSGLVGPNGGDHIAGKRKDPIKFRWSSWHWEDPLDELGKKGNWVSWCFPHYSWSTVDSSSGNSWTDFVLHSVGHLELLLLLLLLLLHHIPLVLCLQVVSQGFGGALANLDDQGWTCDNEYLLTSDDLWASPLVGLYVHRRHFAMAPSRLSPKYLQTLDACFFGTMLLFWTGGMAIGWRGEYVVIIFQFFPNIIWIT